MCRPQLQLPRLCRPQVFTALLKGTISQTSQNHSYLRENDHFSSLFLSLLQFSLKVQGGKSTKATHYFCLYVNMVKNDIICLVITFISIRLCVHCISMRVEVRNIVCVCVCACICRQRAVCIIIHTVV